MRELTSYASASPDPAQGALDAELEAVAVARRIVRPVFGARQQAAIDALEARLRGTCTCSGCGEVMQSEGRPARSWDSLLGGLKLERRQTRCKPCGRHEFPAQRALGLGDGQYTPRLQEAVTMIVGREVKNAVLYDGKDCVQESVERGSILNKTYVSYLGAWLPFALLLWTAMLRLRFDQSRLVVLLSDGAQHRDRLG